MEVNLSRKFTGLPVGPANRKNLRTQAACRANCGIEPCRKVSGSIGGASSYPKTWPQPIVHIFRPHPMSYPLPQTLLQWLASRPGFYLQWFTGQGDLSIEFGNALDDVPEHDEPYYTQIGMLLFEYAETQAWDLDQQSHGFAEYDPTQKAFIGQHSLLSQRSDSWTEAEATPVLLPLP